MASQEIIHEFPTSDFNDARDAPLRSPILYQASLVLASWLPACNHCVCEFFLPLLARSAFEQLLLPQVDLRRMQLVPLRQLGNCPLFLDFP
jgi:hypothetical protein